MSTRRPTVGGNWKMNLDRARAAELADGLAKSLPTPPADVAVFPGFLHLADVAAKLSGTAIKVGAQDFYLGAEGAFTGEVCLSQLADLGVTAALVGHSERRHVIGETDTLVNDKVLAALEAGFDVTLCIGETLEQREAGKTDAVNAGQLGYGLAGVSAAHMAKVTIAYEPVWAIGTGKTATPEDAQAAHAAVRKTVASLFSENVAQAVRIQYGGSMKPGNAAELLAQTDIDGGLIGGASLKPEDFAAIVQAAG
ncbi:MAG: triose-phosphate isomerase [Planctomycetota bacterium]